MTFIVTARGQAFDAVRLDARTGSPITAILHNEDGGVAHNLTFSVPGLAHGPTCKGTCAATQSFTAPEPGTYYFLCTLHDMSGDFVVEP